MCYSELCLPATSILVVKQRIEETLFTHVEGKKASSIVKEETVGSCITLVFVC